LSSNLTLYTSYLNSIGADSCFRLPSTLRLQHPLEHTLQLFDSQQYHQASTGHPRAQLFQATDPYNSVSTAVDTYASYLKSVYTREKLPVYDKWPKTKSKKYINLALIEKEDITRKEADVFTRATIHGNIDDIKQSKRAMDIGQIAQLGDGSYPSVSLWKEHQVWGSPLLPGNCVASGGRESCSSSTNWLSF